MLKNYTAGEAGSNGLQDSEMKKFVYSCIAAAIIASFMWQVSIGFCPVP